MSKFGKKSKKVSSTVDGTFFGARIPESVRVAVPILHDLPPETFKRWLLLVLDVLQGKEVEPDYFGGLCDASHLDPGSGGSLFCGIDTIIRTACRTRASCDIVLNDCVRMNIPEHCSNDISAAIKAKRKAFEKSTENDTVKLPSIDDVKWRIDVAISDTSLSRILRPTIVMQMILSDGKVKTFEMPIEQFHELRYGAAKVLQNMKRLESHPIIKIARDLEKKRLESETKDGSKRPPARPRRATVAVSHAT